MSSSYNRGFTENDSGVPLSQDYAFIDGFSYDFDVDVTVRMVVKDRAMWHYVDDGETVELFVTFNEGFQGISYGYFGCSSSGNDSGERDFEVDIAGQKIHLKPLMCFPLKHCTMFKATAVISSSPGNTLEPGKPVPFNLQYKKIGCDDFYDVSEVTEPNIPVYYQPLWKRLIERDNSMMQSIKDYEGTTIFRPDSDESDGEALERSYVRSTTPVQLAKDDFFLYFTRKSCNPFFKSQNPVLRFIRELMVTPLTNFTGLSLYFQLYLVEIFHVKFFTKVCHYLCMPIIVLLMATWCAQWHLVGDCGFQDVSVFIVNGTLIFVCVLQLWYLIWGCIYHMTLFGILMIWPLFLIYSLANMFFQIAVINSYWRTDNLTVKDVKEICVGKREHWHDVITLAHFHVLWYLNPLYWALFFSFLQALSHAFEDKLPPRVSQTAHWLDLTTVLKENGCVNICFIILSQIFCGTLNEFIASPRLLPLLLLRICYNLGYEEKQWVKFKTLVDECLKFGDPAIDYIGRGGAKWPKKFNEWSADHLEESINMFERSLCEKKWNILKDPTSLSDANKFNRELKYYVHLRHRLTKYKIQAAAYGPFTPKNSGNLQVNDDLMIKDFPDDPAFRIFLKEARSHFAEMEYRFVMDCKLNRVFL